MRLSNIQQIVVVIVMLLVTNALVIGQGIVTGSISGTALDPQGAVVSGANVRATQHETNRVFSTTSSDAGVVQLPALPPSRYAVTVEAKGSQHTRRKVFWWKLARILLLAPST